MSNGRKLPNFLYISSLIDHWAARLLLRLLWWGQKSSLFSFFFMESIHFYKDRGGVGVDVGVGVGVPEKDAVCHDASHWIIMTQSEPAALPGFTGFATRRRRRRRRRWRREAVVPPPPGWIEFLLDSTGIEVVPIKRVFFLNMDSIGFIKTVTSSVLGLFWISFFSDWIGWTRFFFSIGLY